MFSPQLEVPSHLVVGSTKTYDHSVGLSVAFRQWRAESHCRFIHGYAVKVQFTFTAESLDYRNWVVDFGGLKSLKGFLEDLLDHKLLVAEDDPEMELLRKMRDAGICDLIVVPHCGMEALSYFVYEFTEQWLLDAGFGHVKLEKVEVWEHGGNSAFTTIRKN